MIFDKKFENSICREADPFLAAALPICSKKGENLEIDGGISNKLMINTKEIMNILSSWNQGFESVSVKTSISKNVERFRGNIGCFFSGGVDSFYTYLKNKKKINYLIFVHGFDINAQRF